MTINQPHFGTTVDLAGTLVNVQATDPGVGDIVRSVFADLSSLDSPPASDDLTNRYSITHRSSPFDHWELRHNNVLVGRMLDILDLVVRLRGEFDRMVLAQHPLALSAAAVEQVGKCTLMYGDRAVQVALSLAGRNNPCVGHEIVPVTTDGFVIPYLRPVHPRVLDGVRAMSPSALEPAEYSQLVPLSQINRASPSATPLPVTAVMFVRSDVDMPNAEVLSGAVALERLCRTDQAVTRAGTKAFLSLAGLSKSAKVVEIGATEFEHLVDMVEGSIQSE